jgi:hypothetical protein
MMRASLLTLALALLAGAAAAASPEDVKASLEKAYPVQVLKVEKTDLDGKPVYAVRVMNKDTSGNGGYAVSTLLVDEATGRLIPAFRHKASGYTTPETISGEPREINVPEGGLKTWR